MTKKKIVTELDSSCRISHRISSGESCQLPTCGADDFSNYNPMKMVIV